MAKKMVRKHVRHPGSQQVIKYFIGLCLCLLFRLIPFRSIMLPNIEPLTATILPFSKVFKKIGTFVFGAASVIIYDALTSGIGVWTWVTAAMYGLLGLGAAWYLAKKANRIKYYVGYSIVATLIYDAVTGIGIGMLAFNQTFAETFYGQIPFTAMHLAGNIVFAIILSPVIYRWVADNRQLETSAVIHRITQVFSA